MEARSQRLLARAKAFASKHANDSASVTPAADVHEYVWGEAYYSETSRLEITPNQGAGPLDQPVPHAQEFRNEELTIRTSLGGFVWRENHSWRGWSQSGTTEIPLPLPERYAAPRIASMDNPPWTMSGNQPYRLELTMSERLSALGFELRFDYSDPLLPVTVSYFQDTTLVYQRTAEDNWAEPTLVAMRLSDATFNRVVLSGIGNAFYFANFRYILADTLKVQCTPSTVLRGESVRCVMRTGAGAPLSNPQWEFHSDSVPNALQFEGDTVWEGPMAIGGTVAGSAIVGGQKLSDSASVIVRPRPWRANGVVMAKTSPSALSRTGRLREFPRIQGDLGYILMSVAVRPPASDPMVQLVREGPNTSLAFYTGMPLIYDSWSYEINDAALASGSTWRRSFPTGIVLSSTCSQTQLAPLRRLVEEHEGTDPNRYLDSHARIFRDYVDTAGVPQIERAVYEALPIPAKIVAQITESAVQHAKFQTDSTARNPLNRLRCSMNLLGNP